MIFALMPSSAEAAEEATGKDQSPDAKASEPKETDQAVDLGLPEPRPGQVPALGEWVAPERVAPLQQKDNPENTFFFLEEVDEDELESVDNSELLGGTRSGYVTLSTRDRKRIERARKKMRRRVLEQRYRLRQAYWEDPRGKPEIRLCSVHTGGYGLPSEVSRLMRGNAGSAKALRRRERSLLSAMREAECDIVALQGLVGRDLSVIKTALERLTRLLSKRFEKDIIWETVLGESNSRFSRNAFIINTERATLESFESYASTLLPRFEIFEEKKFAQGPLEIQVTVRSGPERPPKRIVLLTALFQSKLRANAKEPAANRMQMADALRQIAMIHQRKINPIDPPLFFLLADPRADMREATQFILQGRLTLGDFREKALCSLGEEQSFSCKEPLSQPAALIPLLRTDWHDRIEFRKKKTKSEDDEEAEETQFVRIYRESKAERIRNRNKLVKQTAGIFTVQNDIKTVWKHPWSPDEFVAGVVPVRNGYPNSPLVWAELNW